MSHDYLHELGLGIAECQSNSPYHIDNFSALVTTTVELLEPLPALKMREATRSTREGVLHTFLISGDLNSYISSLGRNCYSAPGNEGTNIVLRNAELIQPFVHVQTCMQSPQAGFKQHLKDNTIDQASNSDCAR